MKQTMLEKWKQWRWTVLGAVAGAALLVGVGQAYARIGGT